MVTRLLKNQTALLAAVLWIGAMGLVAGQQVQANRSERAGITEVSGTVRVDRNGLERDATPFSAVRRGEIVRTGDASRAILRFGFAHEVFLDERTDVAIERLAEGEEYRVRLIRGRILADTHQADGHNAFGDFVVSTNQTDTAVRYGKLSVVNYDFKETVSVIPIGTVAAVVTNGGGTVTRTPVDIHETDPVTITDISFDPATSSAKSFYEWALNR
jgi:hypothetical protein